MIIDVWCRTDKGLRRESNQDSFLINRDLNLFVVADGMGGHMGGEVASSIAVQTMDEFIAKNRAQESSSRDLMAKAYMESSRRIFDKAANERPELQGMGTTMVACYYDGKSLLIGNVGDSRVYMFKAPYLWQLTEDHSMINEQIRAGLIKEENAKNLVGKNVITRSVGYERDVEPDILEKEVQDGEMFLLCSDGLSGLVSDPKIAEILKKTPAEKIPDLCVEQALAHGGDDNVTVLVFQFRNKP